MSVAQVMYRHIARRMRNVVLFGILSVFLGIFAPGSTGYANDAEITKAEWAKLQKYPGFKKSDQELTAAYKVAMQQLDEDEQKTLKAEQKEWILRREHDAYKKYRKGSPEYAEFLIQEAQKRAMELSGERASQEPESLDISPPKNAKFKVNLVQSNKEKDSTGSNSDESERKQDVTPKSSATFKVNFK